MGKNQIVDVRVSYLAIHDVSVEVKQEDGPALYLPKTSLPEQKFLIPDAGKTVTIHMPQWLADLNDLKYEFQSGVEHDREETTG